MLCIATVEYSSRSLRWLHSSRLDSLRSQPDGFCAVFVLMACPCCGDLLDLICGGTEHIPCFSGRRGVARLGREQRRDDLAVGMKH